jgi:hypothetical protein
VKARRCGLAFTMALVAASTAASQTQVLIVSGLGGDAAFHRAFMDQAGRLAGALRERGKLAPQDVVWLGEDSTAASALYGGISTKVGIEKALRAFAARAQNGGQLVVILIGHGAGEGAESRLSIPGPDVTAAEFQKLLGAFAMQRVAFVDLSSASGDMVETLSAANRVVITATRTALERNESLFSKFFVDAFSKDVADTDKDGRVSLLEAFRYASAETRRSYETASKLLTEHAQLDDNGDKAATAEPTGKSGDGMLARRFFVDGGAARLASNDPRLGALYTERFAIEEQLETLRARKASMVADAYDVELEKVLVALARKSREIRLIEGRN